MVKNTLNHVRQKDMPIWSDSKLQHRSDFGPTIQKEKAEIKYIPGKFTNTFKAFLAPVVAARTTNTWKNISVSTYILCLIVYFELNLTPIKFGNKLRAAQ